MGLVLAVGCLGLAVAAMTGAEEGADGSRVQQDATSALLEGFDASVARGLPEEVLQRFIVSPGDELREEIEEIAGLTMDAARARSSSAVRALGGTDQMGEAMASSLADPAQSVEAPHAGGARYVIFVSQSMPEGILAALAAQLPDDAAMIFRGVAQGQSPMGLARVVRDWTDDPGQLGRVLIDPRPFQELGIEHVPAVALREGDRYVAVVHGVTGTSYLRDAVAAGERGDLGKFGSTIPVSEEDLLERMQRELPARLEARAQASVADYWSSAQLPELGPADALRVRRIDPSVRVTRDVVLPDGQVLWRRGDVVNPFEGRGFGTRLVVLDPTQPWQVRWAKEQIREGLGSSAVQVLITNLDRARGWEAYHELVDALSTPVQLLIPALAERLAIAHVPALVEGDGDQIVIHEFPEPASREERN